MQEQHFKINRSLHRLVVGRKKKSQPQKILFFKAARGKFLRNANNPFTQTLEKRRKLLKLTCIMLI